MKTIDHDAFSEIEINKSHFITHLFKVKSMDEIEEKMTKIKNEYKDASHHCYAYIIDDIRKSSDDGEPGGTAGIPIMEVLLKNDLNYVLAIVTRYFGGVKLGAGGLVRAYSKATSLCLDDDNINNLIPGYSIDLMSNYEEQKKIDYTFKDFIQTKEYNDKIHYTLKIPKEKIDLLGNLKYEIREEILIEQKKRS